MERKELVQLKEDVAGGNHEKDQQSKSEQTEDNTAADGKIQVVPEENPEDKDASKCNEEALFLDRDALELIFRYALTNESAKRSAGTLIKRLFALRDTFARDAIVRVVKRFSKVRFGCGLITLAKDKETAVVTVPQFVWMMRWDILRFDKFDIGSNDNAGCAGLVKVPDLFQLRELKYSALETWSRKDRYCPTLGLALALIKSNVDTLEVLNGVPLWRLQEPLPALCLDRFVHQIGRNAPLSQDMGNLAQCTIKKFEYCFKTLYGNVRLPLSFLAGVDCKEIHRNLNAFRGFESPPEGQTNEYTRRICIKASAGKYDCGFDFCALDIETARRFFPSLRCIVLHILTGYYVWEVRNLMHFFAKVQEFSQALASAQGEFSLRQIVRVPFKHRSDVLTNEATEKATELGFTPDLIDGSAVFKRQVEVATGRIVIAMCILT